MSDDLYQMAASRLEYDCDGMWAERRTYLNEEKQYVLANPLAQVLDWQRGNAAVAVIDEDDVRDPGELWMCLDGFGIMTALQVPPTNHVYWEEPAACIIGLHQTDSAADTAQRWRYARARLLAIGVMFCPVQAATFVHERGVKLVVDLAVKAPFLTVGWPESGDRYGQIGPPAVNMWPFIHFELMPVFPSSMLDQIPRNLMQELRGVAVSFKDHRPLHMSPWASLSAPEPEDPDAASVQCVSAERPFMATKQTMLARVRRRASGLASSVLGLRGSLKLA
jgi:hypothetical protein